MAIDLEKEAREYQKMIKALDPGIRSMVVELNKNGFYTVDSGDGVSKPEAGIVVPVPHVYMAVKDPNNLLSESHRLLKLVDAKVWDVQATYNPKDAVAILGIYGHPAKGELKHVNSNN